MIITALLAIASLTLIGVSVWAASGIKPPESDP